MILKIVIKTWLLKTWLLKAPSFFEDHCKLCLIEYFEKSRKFMSMRMTPELF